MAPSLPEREAEPSPASQRALARPAGIRQLLFQREALALSTHPGRSFPRARPRRLRVRCSSWGWEERPCAGTFGQFAVCRSCSSNVTSNVTSQVIVVVNMDPSRLASQKARCHRPTSLAPLAVAAQWSVVSGHSTCSSWTPAGGGVCPFHSPRARSAACNPPRRDPGMARPRRMMLASTR